jgi:uncharacterized protein (TIGR00369 family)
MDHASASSGPGTTTPRTHLAIDAELCGEVRELGDGRARVELLTTPRMAADERGLVHGGFTFGLADYAAMLAVGHPNVVLAGAEVRFLRPTKVGDRLTAVAAIEQGAAGDGGSEPGNKPWVAVAVECAGETVFSGRFRCYVAPRHVLAEDEEG